MKGRTWTEPELVTLRNSAPFGIAILREQLGRSTASIRQKADEIGVLIRPSKSGDGGKHMRGNVALPEHTHPLIRRFFAAVNAEQCFLHEVASKSGVARATISDWRRKVPRLDNFDAALNSIGWKLDIVRTEVRR